MRYASPRVIRGNRGDLVSRYGILSALHRRGISDLVVFCHKQGDIGELPYPTLPYGSLYNLFPTREGMAALKHAQTVIWTAGLDLQDDSSLAKLLHLYVVFLSYRLAGLKIYVVAQGVGPLSTWWGRFMTRRILNLVEGFLARDPGTFDLLSKLHTKTALHLGHDGIFLGTFDLDLMGPEDRHAIEQITDRRPGQPLIGFNIRQWFHFSSSILPYQFARGRYLQRSQTEMAHFVEASADLLAALRQRLDARIVLVSAYEPGIEPWEDDLPWLQQIKSHFADDVDVLVADQPLPLLAFCGLVAELDVMIGTRLHSTLTAIRFGVPSLNISYTLKGRDIFRHLGFDEWVIDIADFMQTPSTLVDKVARILDNPGAHAQVARAVDAAVQANERALDELLALPLATSRRG